MSLLAATSGRSFTRGHDLADRIAQTHGRLPAWATRSCFDTDPNGSKCGLLRSRPRFSSVFRGPAANDHGSQKKAVGKAHRPRPGSLGDMEQRKENRPFWANAVGSGPTN